MASRADSRTLLHDGTRLFSGNVGNHDQRFLSKQNANHNIADCESMVYEIEPRKILSRFSSTEHILKETPGRHGLMWSWAKDVCRDRDVRLLIRISVKECR